MVPWGHPMAGRLHEHVIDSQALTGNALGDPPRRPLWVWTPPGYEDEPGRRYPVIYRIQGFTGQLDMWRNRQPWRANPVEAADAIFVRGDVPAAILVYADAWTSLGGCQFVDSPAIGRYHTYLCEEVVPFVDAQYRTLPAREHRAIAGKSSGGYGAMITPMLRPDLFSALATHAGDALFEHCYLPDARSAARTLRDRFEGSIDRSWRPSAPIPSGWTTTSGTSSTSTPCPPATPPMPTARCTCLSTRSTDGCCPTSGSGSSPGTRCGWSPRMPTTCGRCAGSGSTPAAPTTTTWTSVRRRFGGSSGAIGVAEPVVRFELFDGTHSGIDWRYPMALAWLAGRIAP